jgi:hypothetical protein
MFRHRRANYATQIWRPTSDPLETENEKTN